MLNDVVMLNNLVMSGDVWWILIVFGLQSVMQYYTLMLYHICDITYISTLESR